MTGLLDVAGLKVQFPAREGPITVVDDVSFSIGKGDTLVILGESGAGKSVLAQALIGLLPPPGEITAGEIIYDGRKISALGDTEFRHLRGRYIGFLFQNPGATFNPLQTVGRQIADVSRLHLGLSQRGADTAALDLLSAVEFEEPDCIFEAFPHELSGGMQQRVALAVALAGKPRLLIADEPTAALDAPLREDILKLFARLQNEMELAILVITHDLRVASRLADRVLLFYAGRIVEDAPASAFFRRPRHPYGRALLACRPEITAGSGTLPASIPGEVADFRDLPSGCRFHPRCTMVEKQCRKEVPAISEIGPDRCVACHVEGA